MSKQQDKSERPIRLSQPNWFFVFWMGWSLFLLATLLARLGQNNTSYGTASEIVFALVGVLAMQLVRKEVETGKKLLFLTFAVLSLTQGVAWPIYNRLMAIASSKLSPNLSFYLFEYSGIWYFVWLTLIVSYLIACVTTKAHVQKGYFFGFVLTAGLSLLMYFPYLQDPNYLLKKPDVTDCRLVRKAVESLKQEGDTTYNIASISKRVNLSGQIRGGEMVELVARLKEERIAFLLTYVRNDWLAGLTYAPLFRSYAFHGFFLAFILVVSSVFWYVKGPPTSAYLEKISWVLVPYCLLEGFHYLVFASLTDWESYEPILAIGAYSSVLLLLALAMLFALRLRFIQTVEGQYYERRLSSDPSRITRWRDVFDNWVLEQFMNPGKLKRRFLTQREEQE